MESTKIANILPNERVFVSATIASKAQRIVSGSNTMTNFVMRDESGEIKAVSFQDSLSVANVLQLNKSYYIGPVISNTYMSSLQIKFSEATTAQEIELVKEFKPNVAYFHSMPASSNNFDLEAFVVSCEYTSSSTQNGGTKRRMKLSDESGSFVNVVNLREASSDFFEPGTYVRVKRARKTDEDTLLNWGHVEKIAEYDESSQKMFETFFSNLLCVKNAEDKTFVSFVAIIYKIEDPGLVNSSTRQDIWVLDSSFTCVRVSLYNNPCEFSPEIGKIVGFVDAKIVKNGSSDSRSVLVFDKIVSLPHHKDLNSFWASEEQNIESKLTFITFNTTPKFHSLSVSEFFENTANDKQFIPKSNGIHGRCQSQENKYFLQDGTEMIIMEEENGVDRLKATVGKSIAIRDPVIEECVGEQPPYKLKIQANTVIVDVQRE